MAQHLLCLFCFGSHLVMQIPTLYLKGTFNGWGLDTPLIKEPDGSYSASICLSTDLYRFKISDLDGTKQWTLSGHESNATACALEQTIPLINTQGIGNDLLLSPTEAGQYSLKIQFTTSTPTLTVTKGQYSTSSTPQRNLVDTRLTEVEGELPTWQHPDFAMPHDQLFQKLAITDTCSFPFAFGDNVDGYYHGTTYNYVNSGKYRHHQGWILGTFASYINGKINNKLEAKHASLMPYGIEHHFDNGQESLSLIPGARLVSLSVSSKTPSVLSLIPELNIPTTHSKVHISDSKIVLELSPQVCPDGSPRFVAIASNHAVHAREISLDAHPEIRDLVQLSKSNTKLMLTTSDKQTELIVYLGFAETLKAASSLVNQAVKNNEHVLHQQRIYEFLTNNYLWTNDLEYNRAVMWSRLASRTFVSHEFGTGIWAGLPWFKDCWGRDTFIALSGTSLVNGLFIEAKEIIENFASMQMLDEDSPNYGRIPNRVTSKTNIIYNTTDGTPWMIREALEYINYSSDVAFAKAIYPTLKRFITGVEKHYLNEDGLMAHRHPDTWMDAKIDGMTPWSPRGPKANDIQALWFESLNCAIQLANLVGDSDSEKSWTIQAGKVKESFATKFWDDKNHRLADHLSQDDMPDYSVRTNQLMTISIPQNSPLNQNEREQYIVKNAVETLLFPWGICSLQQEHVDFHPYHDNQAMYHKDAAYHNGTIWGWNAGFTITALNKFKQQDLSYQLSKNLAKQILTQGCRGTMSENLDAFQEGNRDLVESGTFAQAWSVSEYARNAQQDYLGYCPRLLDNQIHLTPNFPSCWSELVASLPFGQGNQLRLSFESKNGISHYKIQSNLEDTVSPEITLVLTLDINHESVAVISTPLTQSLEIMIDSHQNQVTVNDKQAQLEIQPKPNNAILRDLQFAKPDFARQHNSLMSKDYLLNKRNKQKLSAAKD
ncbi:amylo-alpha-1,6-glucosidase [Vibrio lentus]|uniref:Glycogen debranching protein n=1 Tax=Vibrio lentus TaxID=136468 RepID=A0AB36XG84_9VIBR|nr:amylo-alpha-1,6-glucosidase [Vibrio lentus]MCC4837403.1 amylo-alpha-1,6-glucosidase [Vibrio lentus]PMI13799.1 glycogen debranching protein [Vibrio lentus]PMK33951.1 glycogen debranching protein [Vibrio lentus]PMK39782.1 glycogen debranching protein [Vibrio lentus]PML35229.1 glycogen debranching protein [Vibrio lentus]